MKRLSACAMVVAMGFCAVTSAQDGLYGSFMVGQKFVNNISGFNDAIKSSLDSGQGISRDFAPNYWTFGGNGYLLVAKHLMIGGKAWAFTSGEIVVTNPDTAAPIRKISLSGGIGLFTLGYNILPPNKLGLHLYPQVGVGIAPFVFHSKSVFKVDSQATFAEITRTGNDQQSTISKAGLVLDPAVGIDWHPFKIVFPLFSSVEIWPLIHVEVGYSWIPGNINWLREIDQLDWAPDMKSDGLHINAGVGLGITAKTE